MVIQLYQLQTQINNNFKYYKHLKITITNIMSVRSERKKYRQSENRIDENLSQLDSANPIQREEVKKVGEYREQRYRWVIILLVSLAFSINNLANNAIIPIASKIVKVYGLHQTYANLPIQISFLINPIVNFTAGHFVDSKGLGVSFRIGSILYAVGLFGFVLINYGYHFVLIGAILVSFGQPLIMNSPAKIATFWFLSKNRTLATGVINAINIITLGVSLVFPALFVNEDSFGDKAKQQIFDLYSKYFLVGVANCILIMLFMREKPDNLPSAGAEQQKTTLKQTLLIIKEDPNLWKFFAASILLYGTFLSFGSTSNLLFKPFGFEDTQIALFGVSLLVSGIIGSVSYTLYIKKTLQYRKAIVVACTLAVIFITTNAVLMIFVPEERLLITLMILGMGFNLLPMVPISHDLGCELAFPAGQAQVVGIMTGVAMIYTVILTLSITSIVGFGTSQQSAVNLIIYICLFTLGSVLYALVNIDLKRRKMEAENESSKRDSDNSDAINDQLDESDKRALEEPLNKRSRSESEEVMIQDENQSPMEPKNKNSMNNTPKKSAVQVRVSQKQRQIQKQTKIN